MGGSTAARMSQFQWSAASLLILVAVAFLSFQSTLTYRGLQECILTRLSHVYFNVYHKRQALVYDILRLTTAVFSWGSNSSMFVTLETTQIILNVCFMLPCCLRQLK